MSVAFSARAARVKRTLATRGIPAAEVARRLGYTSRGREEYVRKVLRGQTVSNPLLDRIEAVLEEMETPEAA